MYTFLSIDFNLFFVCFLSLEWDFVPFKTQAEVAEARLNSIFTFLVLGRSTGETKMTQLF